MTWTPCTERCEHRGPYRVRYHSGETVLINTKGCAPASYALIDRSIVAEVTAPHPPTRHGGGEGQPS